MLYDKILGSIKGSLINLNTQEIPNFWRDSGVWMESWVNESLSLYAIESNRPAIDINDGAIYLEPETVNLITHNLKLSNPVWIKGSNCFVLEDKADVAGATGSEARLGDRIVFASGDGASQLLTRTLTIDPGTDYYLSGIFRLSGGLAGPKDVLRIAGNSIPLSQLNAYPNRVRLLELGFKSSGTQPSIPDPPHEFEWVVASVSTNSAVISMPGTDTASGQLVGARVAFGTSTKSYPIISNTATVNNAVTITVEASSLIVDGVSGGQVVAFSPPAGQTVSLEFYVESSLTIDCLGMQLEPRSFRTSFVFQEGNPVARSASKLVFRKNPVADLKTLGILFAVKMWRGDGLIFDLGNLSTRIISKKLIVQTGSVSIASDTLPESFSFYIQVSEENNNISVYLDKKLIGQSNLINFTGDRRTRFNLTSSGVRSYYHIVFIDKLLRDGQVKVGGIASGDVAELFDDPAIVDAKAISTNTPLVVLPTTTVPAKLQPLLRSQIDFVDAVNGTVTVQDTGFPANSPVSVVRDGREIYQLRTKSINAKVVQLDFVSGILQGDFLVYGSVNQPGQASVRFPFISSENLPILDIDPTAKSLRVASTLSFERRRAFIQSDKYEEINEIKIIDKDDVRQLLFVDDLTGIQQGHFISQPDSAEDVEMLVHPDNYEALFLNPVDGVRVAWRYANGLVLQNNTDMPVEIQPCIRVNY